LKQFGTSAEIGE